MRCVLNALTKANTFLLQLMAFKIHVILYTLRGFFEYLDNQRETHSPEEASDEKLLYEYARALLQADVSTKCVQME